MKVFILILFAIEVSICRRIFPSIDIIDRAKQLIGDLINPDDGVRSLIGGFVRLGFHDCFGSGGCDGCIDHSNPKNGGLRHVTNILDEVYEENSGDLFMSRADFYMLSTIVALEKATETTEDKFTAGSKFRVGRKDCKTSPHEDELNEELPSADLEFDGVVKFFKRNFNFNPRESIALLGAHTLGRARSENSGFEGPWVLIKDNSGPTVLDNDYYREIVAVPWIQVQLSSGNFQWQTGRNASTPNTPEGRDIDQPNMLLNSDAALSLTLGINENGQSQCDMCGRNFNRPNCCPTNVGDEICVEFMQNNTLWLSEFSTVFMKMIHRSPQRLRLPNHHRIPPLFPPRP